MDIKQFREKVLQSQNVDWFNTKKITINFSYIDYSVNIAGVSSLYEFVLNQIDGWGKLVSTPPGELNNTMTYFNNVKSHVLQFLNSYHNQPKQNLDNYWNNTQNQINNWQQYHPIPFDSSVSTFLIGVHKDYPNSLSGAYNFIIGKLNGNFSDKNYYIGSLLAYEFILKDHTEITNRRNAEKSSISRLRNDFNKYLSSAETELIEHLDNSNAKYTEYSKAIDLIKEDKEKLFDDWFNQSQEQYTTFDNDSKSKIEELEKIYREKLKLEEPAKYWSERASKLKVQGWISLGVLILLVVAVCIFLGNILWKTPEQIYSSWFGADKSAALRWSIVYVTLISFIAFCIRAVIKVMFSSFHLARDSEERNTLTYFYLSLLKDSKVEDSDRQLIMQSLFSRADTGLLKEDSSPSMPNDFVSKLMIK